MSNSLLPGLRSGGLPYFIFLVFMSFLKKQSDTTFSQKKTFHSVSQFPLPEFENSVYLITSENRYSKHSPPFQEPGENLKVYHVKCKLLCNYIPLSYIALSSGVVQSRLYEVICVVRWCRSIGDNEAGVLRMTTLE